MLSIKRNYLLTLWIVGLFSLTILVGTSMNVTASIFRNYEFSTKATDVYVENFEDTIFRDGSTTSFGWGTGAVTNSRNFTVTPLDFVETPNDVREIDVQGRKVYAVLYNHSSTYDSFGCIDINDPRNIRLLSTRNSFWGMSSIAIDGDSLFVGKGYTSSGPYNQIGSYNATDPFDLGGTGYYLDNVQCDGIVTDIEINGHLVFYTSYNISVENKSFRMVNAENPTNLVGITPTWENNYSLGLDVSGHLAYIAASTDGMYILNTTNKHDPTEVGHIALPGNASDVLVDGRIAYVTLGNEGVAAINVANPASPQLLGIYNTAGNAHRMALQGNTLFVADGVAGVAVLDITDPTHPSFVTQIALPYTWDIDLYGGVLVVGSDEGIHTFSVQAGNGLADISGTWYENSYSDRQAWDVRIRGDLAYVAGGPDGFYILNVRDPNNPLLLDNYSIPVSEELLAIEIDGNIAHLAERNNHYMFDISNPTDITLIDKVGASNCNDVYAVGNIAFIAYGSHVAIVNETDPYNWVLLDDLATIATNVSSIWVEGRYLYVAEYTTGTVKDVLWIYDITDLTAPTLLEGVLDNSKVMDIHVDGDVLYASEATHSVVFNVTDPTNSYWEDWSYPESSGVWNFGPYMLNANPTGSVDIVNTTDITDIGLLYSNENASRALKVTSNGDYMYVANESSLVILRLFMSAGDTYIPGTTFAQSLEIDNTNDIIYSATLDADVYIPADTSIAFFMSADGGANWEPVTLGVEHVFASPGNDLRWRAEITGAEDRSVHLYEIAINYFFNEQPTTPQINEPGTVSVVDNVLITWNVSTDDVGIDLYELQVDTANTFANPTTYNATTNEYLIENMANGVYYFRVRAIDDYDYASDWSAIVDLEIDVPLLNLPWWAYVAAGGGLLLIILVVVISVVVSKKKKAGG